MSGRPGRRVRPAARARATLPTRAIDLLCLATAFTLALHLGHLPAWLVIALVALLAGRWWQVRGGAAGVPLWLKLPLVALLGLAIVVHYGTVFGRAPGAALATGLLVLKLLETNRPRDIRSSVAFGCFVLMSALLFQQGMSFTALVMLGLVPWLAALTALEPRARPSAWHRELAVVAGSLLLAVPLALFAFVFVPRLASPLWGVSNLGSARTGLSSSMSPGNLTQLLIDDSPAMRVMFEGPPPARAQRYFRGWVMSHFDGRTWSHARPVHAPPEPLQANHTVAYSVQLEATSGHILPALDVPLAAPDGALMSPRHEIFTTDSLESGYRYRLRSATRYRLAPRLGQRARARNLALPEGYNPDTRQLAARWRQDYGADHAAIAAAALAMFRQQPFSYTLRPAPLGRNSIDDFLFSTREGFCEHYASAFTFLMRAAGVPARVVTGYQGGYWSQAGNYLLVRKSSAHAWSEVWLEDRGWVRIDPTAAVSPARVHVGSAAAAGASAAWYQAGWIRSLRNHWDIVNRWWNQAVVAFDHVRQQGMLTPFGIERTSTRTLTLILAIGCSLMLALATFFALRQRRPRDPLLAIQRRLEKRLARAGVARRANEGPHDFMQRAAQALPDRAAQLQRIYRHYIHLRYARHKLRPRDIADYRRLVRDSARAVTRSQRNQMAPARSNG